MCAFVIGHDKDVVLKDDDEKGERMRMYMNNSDREVNDEWEGGPQAQKARGSKILVDDVVVMVGAKDYKGIGAIMHESDMVHEQQDGWDV